MQNNYIFNIYLKYESKYFFLMYATHELFFKQLIKIFFYFLKIIIAQGFLLTQRKLQILKDRLIAK